MEPLSTAQQELLNEAVEFGVLSRVKLTEILARDSEANQRKVQIKTAHAPKSAHLRLTAGYEPVRPRLTEEVRVLELSIQITKRELTMCHAERDGSRKTQQLEILNRRLTKYETSLADLRSGSVRKSSDPQFYYLPPPLPEVASVVVLQVVIPEEARNAILLMMDVHALASDLQFVATSAEQSPVSTISAIDAELCLNWSDIVLPPSGSKDQLIWDRLSEIDRYRQCQLLSARTAELVMQHYYRELGFQVEDVSSQQILQASDDWKSFDLLVSGRCIDVKNARESLNGQGYFVEHCVPRFKQTRTAGKNVVIAGVLSTYFPDPAVYREQMKPAIVLGEVDVEDVRGLYRWARHRFGPRLDLKGIWDMGFLPGWIFEYPPEHYPLRSRAIESITALVWRLVEAGAFGNRLPGWVLLLCKDDGLIRSLPLDERKRKLVDDLRSMSASVGVTRRSLYVYAMGLSLEALVQGTSPLEDLTALLELINLPATEKTDSRTLGLQDPMAYVTTIVETMSAIAVKLLDSQIVLTGFRLSHPAILKGVCADGSILTLLAYCGGWQEYPIRAKCGTTPLTIANDAHCPECGHLICHNCGHCSNSCSLCKPRQIEVVRSSRSAQEGKIENFDSHEFDEYDF